MCEYMEQIVSVMNCKCIGVAMSANKMNPKVSMMKIESNTVVMTTVQINYNITTTTGVTQTRIPV